MNQASLDLSIFSAEVRKRLLRQPSQLRASLRWRLRFCLVAFLVFSATAAALLWEYGPRMWAHHRTLFYLTIAIASLRFFDVFFDINSIRAVALDTVDTTTENRKLLGRYSAEEIKTTVDSVGKKLGAKESPNLYISIDKSANATTTNSMFFNFLPRFNAIYLNSYLFNALKRNELKAILVHELAHFHRYMDVFTRNTWIAIPLYTGLMFAVFSLIPYLATAWYTALLALLITLYLLFVGIGYLITLTGRDLEYASDAEAAETIGALPIINALHNSSHFSEFFDIKIGEILYYEIYWRKKEADFNKSQTNVLRV